VLHVAASVLGSRTLRTAACAYSRAARHPYGRIPYPTQTGRDLRRAARLLSGTARTARDRDASRVALLMRLAGLATAVSELRHAQRHATQAAAARRAAESLHAARCERPPVRSHPATAATVASAAFPETGGQLQHQRPAATRSPANPDERRGRPWNPTTTPTRSKRP
jgi:hypothetical protein